MDGDVAVRRKGGNYVINVRVQPRASRNEVLGVQDGRLRVRTTVAPTDGKANKSVILLLARHLGVAPSRITQSRGLTHRNKQFIVEGPLDLPNGL